MHSQTYTKRRILNRPEDGTEFEVETRTVYTVKALQRVAFLINLPVALPFVGIHFIIERIFVVIHIVSTQSNTKVKTVIYIEGNIEIILVNTATLTRQEISIRFGRNIRRISIIVLTFYILKNKCTLIPHSPQPSSIIMLINILATIVQISSLIRVIILRTMIERISCIRSLLRHTPHLRYILIIYASHQPLHRHILIE